MKEKYVFRMIYIILIITLGVSLYSIFTPQKATFGVMFGDYYNILENDMKLIKTNMNEITIRSDDFDWRKLKESNIDDKKLKNTYNSLVSDIRNCYLLSNDNPSVLEFKNKKGISERQFIQLNKKENCLYNFKKYNTMVLSNNVELSERIKNQISIIVSREEETIKYNGELSGYNNFISLLHRETDTISRVANLSNWLRIEYYSRKGNG